MSAMTKKMLSKSLLELLSKTTLDGITIHDITDHADVSRKTFYYHFQDVYDLLEWTIREEMQKVVHGNDTKDTWTTGLLNTLKYCRANKDLVTNTFHSIKHKELEGYINELIMPVIDDILKEQKGYSHVEEDDIDFIRKLYCYGITGLIMRWISDDLKTEPEYIVGKIEKFFTGSMTAMLSHADMN